MASEATKRFNDLFGKVRARIEKISESVNLPKDDDDLIDAVIQRIDVDSEAHAEASAPKPPGPEDKEEKYKRLMKRLAWQLSKSGIGVEELVRTYPGDIQAVLLYKSYEKFRGGDSNLLREKFIEMGWKNIQPNVWVLPPSKTPTGSVNQEELKIWARRKLTKPFGKDLDYVFPFIIAIDLKKVTAEKKGTRKMPVARTIFNVLEPSEAVPSSHLYNVMKSRGWGVRDIILSGDIPFLASAFATSDDLLEIQENEETIASRLRSLTGSKNTGLQDIANLGADLIADAFGTSVAHPKDLAQRLIIEAQFWMRHLGGSVPSPGPDLGTAPIQSQAPIRRSTTPEPAAQSEQAEEPETESKPGDADSWSDSEPVPS